MKTTINRRKFLKQAGFAGSALALGYYFSSCKDLMTPEPEGVIELFKMNVDDVFKGADLMPNIVIDKSGLITIVNHRPDMGQGTFQSVPLLIAEELDVSLDQITIKQGQGDFGRYGQQGVGGSQSMKTMWEPMRKMGASAREMLVKAAADQWQVGPEDCKTENGKVINTKTKESLPYGDLVEAASKLDVPETPKLKDPKDFKLIGKSVPRPSVALKSSGQANFGMDMNLEGMVYASIERSPSFSAKVKSIDDTEALAVPGVEQVIKTTRQLGKFVNEGVAVIASNYWAALKGRKALKIEWAEDEKLRNTAGIFEDMRQKAKTDGEVIHKTGNFNKTIANAVTKVSAEYETPFLAHSAMEPQNVLVDFKGETCELWVPTQYPNWLKGDIAKLLGWGDDKINNITIHVPFLGGGFGRKAIPDVGLEGVALSKAIGKPVKIIWSREDDTTQSPFRPGSVNVLNGGLDSEGNLVALEHKVTSPSIMFSMFGAPKPGGAMEPIGEGFYNIPNYQSKYVFVDVDPIPVCWWRSVYSSTNVFAHECFIDVLAEKASKDPYEFRLKMMDHQPRRKKVLEMLAEKSGWKNLGGENKGRGIAITHCFDTTAGHVVEVSKDSDGTIKIDKITSVIDCGIAVNPDFVKAQTEGNIVMGLTAALKDPITFENGRAVESNFDKYRMLRIDEMPEINIHVMENLEDPTGAGEPALPPLAPALINAIADLTGIRINKLPIDLTNIG